jgi:hypothetical protein
MTSQQQRDWQELCLKAVMESDPKKQTAEECLMVFYVSPPIQHIPDSPRSSLG